LEEATPGTVERQQKVLHKRLSPSQLRSYGNRLRKRKKKKKVLGKIVDRGTYRGLFFPHLYVLALSLGEVIPDLLV
jgi:hypothetical protein